MGLLNIVSCRQKKEIYQPNDCIKIGLLLDSFIEQRWYWDKNFFKEAAEALGAEVKVHISASDTLLQLEQAKKLIGSNIDVLVTVPTNMNAAAKIVDLAHKKNIKVIAYDKLIKNCDLDFYIGFDNEEIGRLQASYLIRLVPSGNYVVLGGAPVDDNSYTIKKSQIAFLSPFIKAKKLNIISDQWVIDNKPEEAARHIRNAILQYKTIDAVLVHNDSIANAVEEVLAEYGLVGKVPITGQDAEILALNRIKNGKQCMTIYKPIDELAAKAAEVAINFAKGKTFPVDTYIDNGKSKIPSIIYPVQLVDKENIDEILKNSYFSRINNY
jgi:D-xylose ABC transporter substrate-binding protein